MEVTKMLLCIYLISVLTIQSINSLSVFPTVSEHQVKPRTASTANKFLPTNAWFQNWMIGTGENPIHTYPYILRPSPGGLRICYPSMMVNQNAYILEVFNDNLVLSTREGVGSPLIDVSTVNADFFDISAKINFGSSFSVTGVRGSASLVVNINSGTPSFKTIHAILGSQKLSDRAFTVNFNNDQTWMFQTQTALQWSVSGSEVFGQSKYTGWLKISIVTGSEAQNALLNAQDLVITNGKVSHSVDRTISPAEITVKLEYNNQGLYYILPHVQNQRPTGTSNINGAFAKGIKGTYQMSRGVGYEYKLPIYEGHPSLTAFNTAEKRTKLTEAVKADAASLNISSKDPYFGGKELARAARLIEIASMLGDYTSKTKIKNDLVKELDDYWFGISNRSPALVHEPTWGGIVSRASVGSMEEDFGIYYYNDHHFHYGYFINAAATLALHYPDYYNSRAEYFNLILSDFAGTCIYKELPCKPRNKDPFMGHSFASGLFEFSDTRNQESTSEAINAYFAVRELGRALKNQSLEDLGDYLLSSEILATKTYWLIKNPSNIYAPPFSKNGVVGIVWETKVDYATWFGGNVEFIYGIQMLPFTEMTTNHLEREWLKETRPIWSATMNTASIEEGWKGFMLLADAIVDPQRSGLSEQIHNLQSYDNGNSRTNTLYFYYMVGGTPSSGGVITPGPGSSTVSSQVTTQCVGSACSVTDNGKPDPACGLGLLGCHNTAGQLVGCYNPLTAVCYFTGFICPKPLAACINLSGGAQCYDTSMYQCVNGNLNFIG